MKRNEWRTKRILNGSTRAPLNQYETNWWRVLCVCERNKHSLAHVFGLWNSFFSCSSSSSHLLRGPSVKYFDCPSHKRDRSTVADWRLFYILMVFIIPKSDELILFLSWRIQKMYCLPLGILFLFDTDVVDMAYS